MTDGLTVFTFTENTKHCPCCNKHLAKSDFYFESPSKKKYPGQLRKFCKKCWNRNNGKDKAQKVVDVIKSHGVYFGTMIYDSNKMGFNWTKKEHSYNKPAVYFMVEENRGKMLIHKVGMTNDKRGLNNRLSKYVSDNNKNLEASVKIIHNVMTNELNGKKIKIYYVPVPETETKNFYGLDCEYTLTRKIEFGFANKAIAEEHPMLLCRNR